MKKAVLQSTFLLFIITTSVLVSCTKKQDDPFPVDPVPINLTADQISLVESENSFAYDIFKKVLENTSSSENVIISPLSISCALSMTLNGAAGTTRDAMLETLRVNGLSPETINNSYKNLSEALLSVDKRVLISIANSVWTENNFVVKKPFTDILTGYYNAESKSFNINDPLAPKLMNGWIESKTNGLIKNMIDQLNSNTVMLLINAIYFNGKWKSGFLEKNTVTGTFYKPGTATSSVPMMKQTADFKIYANESLTLAQFAYGQGNYVMDIILPKDRNGIDNVTNQLTGENLTRWIGSATVRETNLTFPRFKYGYKKKLKDDLSNMGMGIAFTDNANFSNISDIGLLINDVTHQAFIETNEEGTEAAAATVVDIGTTSMPMGPYLLSVDHSFLFLIRETSTNSILFMGRVVDPLVN